MRRWVLGNVLLSGLFALCWLLLRSGTKPSRLAYPCQQAALSTASLAFGAPLVAALLQGRRLVVAFLRTRTGRGLAAATLFLFGLLCVYSLVGASAAPLRVMEPPPDYRATVYSVSECPQDPVGDRFVGLENLFELMGSNGLKIYQSAESAAWSGPDGIVGSDDVVIIKINYQWAQRGGTNTDLLRGLIRVIVDHPDGFSGEVVVCENAQTVDVEGFDRARNNAQDQSLSPHDVVMHFRQQGLRVSHFDWTAVRLDEVAEFSAGDMNNGYVVYSESDAGGHVSYPKFRTEYGTNVSVRDGVFSGGSYDRDRLCFINVPVLKTHGRVYGMTACVKNYMGLVTNGLGTNSHFAIATGLLGWVIAEIGPADLNILDCIWVNASPYDGPETYYSGATRLDQLVAGTDPIAVDMWAATNVLIPAYEANGFSPPWPRPDATPDDPNSTFRRYLDNSMEYLLAAGYRVTNDINSIDAITPYSPVRRPEPRRPSGRVAPAG